MRILGIDPGTARLGYGVIDADDDYVAVAFGTLETGASDAMADRLLQIHIALANLIGQTDPDVVVIEQLFFSRNVTTAIAVGQARGVAMLAAAQAGLAVVEYTPAEIKQAISGYGNADKHQVQAMVKILLALDEAPKPDDAADALAIALCHGQSAGFRDKVEQVHGQG